jgi:hypothetical protein
LRVPCTELQSGFALSEIIPHNLGGHNLRSNGGAQLCQFVVGTCLFKRSYNKRILEGCLLLFSVTGCAQATFRRRFRRELLRGFDALRLRSANVCPLSGVEGRSLSGVEGALFSQNSMENSAPLPLLRTVREPPMFFSMMVFDMKSPTPVPDWGSLVVK